MTVEGPRRQTLSSLAIWSLMAGLYTAIGHSEHREYALWSLVQAVTEDYQRIAINHEPIWVRQTRGN